MNTFLLVVMNLFLEHLVVTLESPIFLFSSCLLFQLSGEVSWRTGKSQDDLPSPTAVLCIQSRSSAPNRLHHPLIRCVLQWCCLGKSGQVLALKSNWHAMFPLYQSIWACCPQGLRVTSEDPQFPCRSQRCSCNTLVFCNLKMSAEFSSVKNLVKF